MTVSTNDIVEAINKLAEAQAEQQLQLIELENKVAIYSGFIDTMIMCHPNPAALKSEWDQTVSQVIAARAHKEAILINSNPSVSERLSAKNKKTIQHLSFMLSNSIQEK